MSEGGANGVMGMAPHDSGYFQAPVPSPSSCGLDLMAQCSFPSTSDPDSN